MRAILVSVDYSDLLAVTLPYNLHHFERVMVVTSPEDYKTKLLCEEYPGRVDCFATPAFYDDGAVFNKWKALEQGLDAMGRYGWICIMDADVLWPMAFPGYIRVPGYLYTPRRRMYDPVVLPIPTEDHWTEYPLHPQQREFAGYTQIFHADDPVLGSAPWHETNWRHAGGADSFFQAKWENDHKVRPPFEVLHLGSAGQNWCGRATPYLDGSVHPEAYDRQETVRRFIRGRSGGPTRFDREKL